MSPHGACGSTTEPDVLRPRLALACIFGVAALVFAIRLAGPPNLLDNEYRLGATVLDAVRDGNWLCPHDTLGNTDKPPLLTWLSALVTLAVGRVNVFTLYLPSAAATLGVAWLVVVTGRRYFSMRAGFLGGLAYLLSDVGAHGFGTARWDALFAFTVALTALAAFGAWMRGGGWLWFWLAAAAATLTKGPLGLVLGASGLLATVWERRDGTGWRIRGSQATGVLAYLAITLGWFLLAWWVVGPHLVEDMIGQELVGHAVESVPGRHLLKPVGDFFTNFGPWSLLTALALVRVVRTPAASVDARRFERFLVCWFVPGLVLFSLSPHTAARLLWPIVPAAALLAGRELADATRRLGTVPLLRTCVAATAVACAVFVFQYHWLARLDPEVQATRALEALAGQIGDAGGERVLEFVDVPPALQLALSVSRRALSFDEAVARLRGPAPAFVAVEDAGRLRKLLGADAANLHELAHGTLGEHAYVHVFANRAHWQDPDPSHDLARVDRR